MNKIERMIDDVIRKYGFEAEATLFFCRLCKNTSNLKHIKWSYKELMER